MSGITAVERHDLVRRGLRLQRFSIAWNLGEALLSIAAGVIGRSTALIAFGADSLIEMASALAVVWRLHRDRDQTRRDRAERASLRIAGACLIALAPYVASESAFALLRHEAPERSFLGIGVAIGSLIAMPLLASAKRKVAADIGSNAMRSDAKQAAFCAYLSGILLAARSGRPFLQNLEGLRVQLHQSIQTLHVDKDVTVAVESRMFCSSSRSGLVPTTLPVAASMAVTLLLPRSIVNTRPVCPSNKIRRHAPYRLSQGSLGRRWLRCRDRCC
jgi:divalent metal cation (Fe/Co/Zn/Cd) transporter